MYISKTTSFVTLWLTLACIGTARAEQAGSSELMANFLQSEAPLRLDFGTEEHASFTQFYGIIDLTRASINHSLPANYQYPNNFYPYAGARINAQTTERMHWVNGGLQGSRFGIRGEFGLMQLDDTSIKLNYQFEGGFNPLNMSLNNAAETLADNSGTNANSSISADTSLNGELFSRQAWVGIDADNYGRVSYGTQYNPFFDIFAGYDPNNKSDTFSPFGESGAVGGGGGISENSRMKHSVKYANNFTTKRGVISLSGMMQAGNAASTSHGEGLATQLGFENNQFGIQLAWNKFTDAVRASSADPGNPLANDTISGALFNTQATLLALRWLPTRALRISGGWQWYELRPSSDTELRYSHLFDQPVFGGVLRSGLAPGFKQNNNVYFIGARFQFADRFPALSGLSASVGFYDTRFDAIKGPTASTNSQGEIDTWTGILDYVFNRRFDTYLAYTNNYFKGDRYPTASFYNHVNTVGAGIRLRF